MPDRTYRPAWWLPGPHLPTLWGKFFRHAPDAPTRRERCETPDGDFVDLERLSAPAPGRPRLLLLHGLEGSPRSRYVRGLFAEAHERGWATNRTARAASTTRARPPTSPSPSTASSPSRATRRRSSSSASRSAATSSSS